MEAHNCGGAQGRVAARVASIRVEGSISLARTWKNPEDFRSNHKNVLETKLQCQENAVKLGERNEQLRIEVKRV